MATFGKLTDGAGSSASSTDKAAVSTATPASSGTITAGHARIWMSAGSTTARMVVYADSAGAPGALLAQSDAVTVSNLAEAQVDFVFSGGNQIAITGGTPYWIGVSWQDPGTPSLNLSRDATASGRQEVNVYLPNPFGTPTAQAGPLDAYIDYTVAAVGGIPLTPEIPAGTMGVEVAWGADLTDLTGAGWTWTDITTDVRHDPGLSWRLGRGDESASSQPAELTLTLDNTGGKYSLGGLSANYPNVRRGTPVRVRIDTGSGAVTAYLGFATGWQPGWDAMGGTVPTVALSASGTLRRLAQGAAPVLSPIRRYLRNAANVVAYWPCEEGRDAVSFLPDVGLSPITWSGIATPGTCESFAASQPIATTNGVSGIGGSFSGPVDTYTPAADFSQCVRLLLAMPAAGSAPADQSVLFRVRLSNPTCARFDVNYRTGGSLEVKAYNSDGVQVAATGAVPFLIDGRNRLVSLEMFQSGGTLFYGLNTLQVGETNYVSIGGGPSLTAQCSLITGVDVDPSAAITGVGFGHVAVLNVRSAVSPLTDTYQQLNGYPGEVITGASGRLQRLCTENAVGLTTYGGVTDTASPADAMGPQKTGTLLDLLADCQNVERGQLWDGRDPGLAYSTRRRHEDGTPLLTLDASAGQLAGGFAPVDDDQRLVNRAEVTLVDGGTVAAADLTGVMGSNRVGLYTTTATVNASSNAYLPLLAGWLVARGTLVGYRYPSVRINLRRAPSLAAAVVALVPGARVDVTNLTTLAGLSPGTVSLTVEGIRHDYAPRGEWTVELSCSPYDGWRVGDLASDSGDTNADIIRPDTDGATLASAASLGATSLSVATPSGPLWTTVADDFPLTLDVGGLPVVASACSGASSPQTFTVAALVAARASGTAVKVWNPPGLGL